MIGALMDFGVGVYALRWAIAFVIVACWAASRTVDAIDRSERRDIARLTRRCSALEHDLSVARSRLRTYARHHAGCRVRRSTVTEQQETR